MRARSLLGAGFGLGLLTGCLDLAQVVDVAFPPSIPGLPAGGAWMSLPVGVWLTEGDVSAVGIAACGPPACPHAAVVGSFVARGAEAGRLAALASRPDRLAAFLDRRTGAHGTGHAGSAVLVRAERARNGFTLSMTRGDGRNPAWSEVRLRPSRGGTSVVVVIGDDPGYVRDLARNVSAGTAAATDEDPPGETGTRSRPAAAK